MASTLASLGKATTIDNKHLWTAGGGGRSHSFYQAGWSTMFMPNIHPNINSIGKWQPTPSASTIGKFHAPPIKCKTKYNEQVSILTNAPPLHSSCLWLQQIGSIQFIFRLPKVPRHAQGNFHWHFSLQLLPL